MTFYVFCDIVVKVKELPTSEGKIINKVISVCKLILVNPASSASGERSFSAKRRLTTMRQERFSNLTILNSHKERTERLFLVDITNEFSL